MQIQMDRIVNDHAVYGDLKLVKADYDANEYLVPAVSELEEKIVGEFAGRIWEIIRIMS